MNDKVIARAPSDIGVSYYDGGRTYDSSRNEMIYPLLEDFAKKGRWLGVYPQITHSWRCGFPWTGPQFIRFRCREFARKGLSNVIGYAVPGNAYSEFNVAAMAEWSWNADGRTAEEFCRAWATRMGVCEPDQFVKWAIPAGEAGWSLAETNLFLSAIYNPSLSLGHVPFDHRFAKAGVAAPGNLSKALSQARESLRVAEKVENREMILESKCTLAGLEAFEALNEVHPLLSSASLDSEQKARLSSALDRLDECALLLRSAVIEWGEIRTERGPLPGRLFDTAYALLRTSDIYRAKAAALGVADSHPELRPKKIGEWSEADFAGEKKTTLMIDVSDLVPPEGGRCNVRFEYIDSMNGTDIAGFLAHIGEGAGALRIKSPDWLFRVSRWERDHELRVEIPKRDAGTPVKLEIVLSGPGSEVPADRRSCSGAVSLRRLTTD